MPPLNLNTDSFIFKKSPLKRPASNKFKATKRKKAINSRASGPHSLLTIPTHESTNSLATNTRSEEGSFTLSHSPEVTDLLKGRTIYIEKKLNDYAMLKEIADAMGASVKETLDKFVTDYITDFKPGKKLLDTTSIKGNRCVSPLWLVTCYQQKRYLPSINFPVELKTHINTLPAVASPTIITRTENVDLTDAKNTINEVNNPFGLEEVDYDYLEAHKPGNQLNLDGYITREKKARGENNDMDDAVYNMSEAETVRLQEEMSNISEEGEGRKEFFYNTSSDNSHKPKKREESEQEIADRNKRSDEIRIQLSKAKTSASTSSSATSRAVTRSSSQKVTSTGFYGQDKFTVWYGEQDFTHVTSNKRS